jgi:hypothetical protein
MIIAATILILIMFIAYALRVASTPCTQTRVTMGDEAAR